MKLLTGWSRTREVAGTVAVPQVAVPVGHVHAVKPDQTSEALCGAVILALGPPWPPGLGTCYARCQKLTAH